MISADRYRGPDNGPEFVLGGPGGPPWPGSARRQVRVVWLARRSGRANQAGAAAQMAGEEAGDGFWPEVDGGQRRAVREVFPKAVAKVTGDVEELLAFYDYPA